jgi:hypothetical protein
MIWLIIEAALAVAILVGIVWWTLPRQPRPADPPADDENKRGDGDR